jgi:hypothetical protein
MSAVADLDAAKSTGTLSVWDKERWPCRERVSTAYRRLVLQAA